MARASKPGKATRKRYSSQCESEALPLAERVGVSGAAKQPTRVKGVVCAAAMRIGRRESAEQHEKLLK